MAYVGASGSNITFAKRDAHVPTGGNSIYTKHITPRDTLFDRLIPSSWSLYVGDAEI